MTWIQLLKSAKYLLIKLDSFNQLKSKIVCYNMEKSRYCICDIRQILLVTIFMIKILRNLCVDSLAKQMQFYVILDAVIVVRLLTFIEPFVWTYMTVNY